MNAVPAESAAARPRVEGDREVEILEATLDVLAEAGYDRLTMDAVATRAKASKATLYRRWANKVSLVIDALLLTKDAPEIPDTGSLRGDLLAAYCGDDGHAGLMDVKQAGIFSSIITALPRDPEFAAAFREKVLGPKIAVSAAIYANAKARGEVREDLDETLFGPALAGMCLHRMYVLGEAPDRELIARIVDQIIVPAATSTANPSSTPHLIQRT